MTGNGDQAPLGDESTAITAIAPTGDVVIDAFDEKRNETFSYRVNVQHLRQNSAYFDRLLDPKKFGEGASVAKKLDLLRKSHVNSADVSVNDLPRVQIVDIGRISKVNSIKPLFSDFLKVLHGQDIVSVQSAPGTLPMPIANLANLAVVADRFDALPHTSLYIRRKRILDTIDARTKGKVVKANEERSRQKALIGLLLDHASWLSTSTQSLIIAGSVRWKSNATLDIELPLWWDLPRGIEEELISRRDYVLDTLQSIALHFVNLYSSTERQCKLGYDSSWVCDSFQLGEMFKFFKKNNLVKSGPVLTGQDELDPYEGDIERFVEIFKSCPTYQMDSYHSHCGLRTRVIPLIERLEPYLRAGVSNGVGICGACWEAFRAQYAWSEAKRPVAWRAPVMSSPSTKGLSSEKCLLHHVQVRDMFTAVLRDWTPREEQGVRPGMSFGMATPTLRH